MEELLKYARELIIELLDGNEEAIEQITEEIIESGYTTKEEILYHLDNYYL